MAACTNSADLDEPPVDLGNFLLGHNVVVASKAQKGPLSREATPDEWVASLKSAIGERFGRYDGTNYYHIGVSVEGYVIAQPGIPLVLSPKSILIVNLTVWDDAQNRKLTDKPKQITVFESLSGGTLVGTGYTMSKEEQMKNLSMNAAKAIQNFLVENREWFGPDKMPPPKPAGRAPQPLAAPAGDGAAPAPAAGTAAAPVAGPVTGPVTAPVAAPVTSTLPPANAVPATSPAAQVFAPIEEPDVIGPAGSASGG
ncbi:hypothetical protein GLS40_14885 [Pseudooceanicola sp. 216_PA32_1]|uniref:Uncharacterized protein n=2 Tax=Pseudooceanicola pacificus TaxID=2676438 RepID=A0A844WCZ6_9RHOB|nr:hypothetical protein [Pseudooceanicola pacificus]